MAKTKNSPVSPKNTQLQTVQAFGATADEFSPKRETTLGYFSVMEPYAKGQQCFRLARHSNKTGSVKRGATIKLKSDLLKNVGEETIVSDRTSNISANESH